MKHIIKSLYISIIIAVLVLFVHIGSAQSQVTQGICCDTKGNGSKACLTAADCSKLDGYECKFNISTCPGSLEDLGIVTTTKIDPFVAKSGIEFTGDVGPALLANYMIALNKFFFRLAIVLAVFMITLGGLQWLMAIGNASRISNAKDTLQQAIIGLILALTAFLLFSQIDESFVSLKVLNIAEPSVGASCSYYNGRTQAECENAPIEGGCRWQSTVADEEGGTGGICVPAAGGICTLNSDCQDNSFLRSQTSVFNDTQLYCIPFDITNARLGNTCTSGYIGPCWEDFHCGNPVYTRCVISTDQTTVGGCCRREAANSSNCLAEDLKWFL